MHSAVKDLCHYFATESIWPASPTFNIFNNKHVFIEINLYDTNKYMHSDVQEIFRYRYKMPHLLCTGDVGVMC